MIELTIISTIFTLIIIWRVYILINSAMKSRGIAAKINNDETILIGLEGDIYHLLIRDEHHSVVRCKCKPETIDLMGARYVIHNRHFDPVKEAKDILTE